MRETSNSLRLLVMGAGALGSAVGGFMARAGHAVTLVGRIPHMEAIRRAGLSITGIWGDHLIRNLTTALDPREIDAGDFDVIVLTVKSYDTGAAVEAVAPLGSDETLFCSYQNGLGNAERIARAVGWERTVGARAIYGVRLTEPGRIEITVIAEPTALGVWRPETPAARVRALAAAMDRAGLPTVFVENMATVLWAKVAYNAALNPLSALLDVPYGALLGNEHTRGIMGDVVRELYAVAEAMGVALEPPGPEAYISLLFDRLIPPTAAHYASMREDFLRKRRTEIDALNGAICRHGREFGIPCPTNSVLTRLVRAREASWRPA